MSDSILQVNQIKDKGGNATGITVADTSANVTIGNLTATSLAGGTIASAVNFPAGHVIQAFQSASADSGEFGDVGGTQLSVTLGTASGTSALTSASNNVMVIMQAYVVKRNSGTSNFLNTYLIGGGLGTTTSGIAAGRTQGLGDGDNTESGSIYAIGFDTNPGSTTPQYGCYCTINNANQNFQLYSFRITCMEIKA